MFQRHRRMETRLAGQPAQGMSIYVPALVQLRGQAIGLWLELHLGATPWSATSSGGRHDPLCNAPRFASLRFAFNFEYKGGQVCRDWARLTRVAKRSCTALGIVGGRRPHGRGARRAGAPTGSRTILPLKALSNHRPDPRTRLDQQSGRIGHFGGRRQTQQAPAPRVAQ